jgi:shikimate dehydrogenase
MREYGLIGYPLSHSFSQKYFTEKFLREGIQDAVFHAFSIPSINDLQGVLHSHPSLVGFCITIPYKKAILPYLHQASAAVKQMGACNCVKIEDGKLIGYNTDVVGFENSFIKKLQAHHTQALILGTGGAAAAVEYTLQKLGIAYRFVSRTAKVHENILGYADLNSAVMHAHTVIINCTPLGTYPKTDEAPAIPYTLLTPQHYLYDLVYNPPLTKFLQLGQAQGAATHNGHEMLEIQAEENWKIWNGVIQ